MEKKEKNENLSFKKLFFKKENKELVGENYKNFWIIFVILFVTFLAIGFANGSLKYLGKKMKDPFVNWVNVTVPYSKINKIKQIREKLNEPNITIKYNINNITGYNKGTLQFWDIKDSGNFRRFYRTVSLDDPILGKILSPKNLIRGRGFDIEREENMSELGVIVKEDMLKTLHYDLRTPFVFMTFKETDSSYRKIPIPIIGVVKDLPGMSDLITTQYFFRIRNFPFKGNIFNPHDDRRLIIYSNDDSVKIYQAVDKISNFYQEKLGVTSIVTVEKNKKTYKEGYNIIIDFWPDPKNIIAVDNYYNELKESGLLNALKSHIRLYDYESRRYRIDDIGRYENIAVNFKNLDKVRAFANYLTDKYEIQIDTAQISAKENYNFITKLTRIISLILIAFSILSVCLFVSNLLNRHLENIKMNLGTLKAFGLSNFLLQKIYLILITRFLSVSIVFSLLIAWLLGQLGFMRFILSIFGDNLEKGEMYFNLFDIWTLIAILLILTISIMVIVLSAHKILKKTPGDLIYNR